MLAVVYKLVPAGLENRLMDIIRCLDTSRVIIDVFTYQLDKGIYDEEVESLGGKVYYNKPLTPYNMFGYVYYFRDFLIKHPEYKIVHAHQDAWCSVFCKGAYLADTPIRIAHSRTAISTISFNNLIKNIIKIPTKKYANYYFAVSNKAGRWLFGNRLYDLGKVVIWPNAIDATKYYFNGSLRSKVRKDNGWDSKFVVMHVGNITPPKNHSFILKVFNEIIKKNRNSVLVLIGAGDKSRFDEYISDHRLENNVLFLGSRTDVNNLLQAADVFLFPSLFEGLPGALVEAQAAGLPCVLSDTIAEEIRITPNLTIKPLSEGAESWANEVLMYKDFIRSSTKEYIEEKGFDVRSLTMKLCDFYEQAYEEAYKGGKE